jgi:4'-phosphopantetheinyl transferase
MHVDAAPDGRGAATPVISSRAVAVIEVTFSWALVGDVDVAAAEARLTDEERARLGTYHFELGRREFLARRALERAVRARHAPARPRLNLSGTNGLVACASATADVALGVDVEIVERLPPHEVVRAFASSELAAMRALPPEAGERRLYEVWTLKEAYAKARGLGLALPLDQVAFVIEAGAPVAVSFGPGIADDAASWEFRSVEPTPGYVGAVAVRRPPGTRVDLVVERAPL